MFGLVVRELVISNWNHSWPPPYLAAFRTVAEGFRRLISPHFLSNPSEEVRAAEEPPQGCIDRESDYHPAGHFRIWGRRQKVPLASSFERGRMDL